MRRRLIGWRPWVLVGLILATLASLGACAAEGASPTPAGPLAITSHRDGDAVAMSLIAVEGTAPAKAAITRDIPMARDTHSTADDSGHWKMPVSLHQGDNSLTFRIGDDKKTAKTIHIVYNKPASTPHPTHVAATAPAETPTSTRGATPTATPASPTVAPSAVAAASTAPAPAASATSKPTATPKPTATATTTVRPTVVATPQPTLRPTLPPANLGTRDDLKFMLSAVSGYAWKSSPLLDGTPRSLAMSDDQLADCEIIGPDSAVTAVDVLFVAGDYAGTYHVGAMLGILLDGSQSMPAITWAEDQITSALSKNQEIDKTRTFGNRRVEVITGLMESSMVAIVVVTPA